MLCARLTLILLLLQAGSLLSPAQAQAVKIEPASDHPRFVLLDSTTTDFSGITWVSGPTYAAVSDKQNIVREIRLTLDPTTGAITRGAFGSTQPVRINGISDFEGITWAASEKAFYISAETGHAVVRFVPATGTATLLPIPPIFKTARNNLSLESITWNETARELWIANEEALAGDGPVSSAGSGTLVRLQKFDATKEPVVQYAWRTEPALFRYGQAGSGVSDLCLLPTGQLLVLERGFAGLGLQLRIYLADFSQAADTSRQASLQNNLAVQPAGKTLLFREMTGMVNFEGLALGPELAGGWHSLLVIADSNGGPKHTLLALKVRWDGH